MQYDGDGVDVVRSAKKKISRRRLLAIGFTERGIRRRAERVVNDS